MYRQTAITKNLRLRADVIAAIRRFFRHSGYLEVETPYRIPAPAPEAHIDAEPSGAWFLHTSPELCMKRLLAAGYPRIYQFCRCFRKGERGRRHLPEMTMLEWYTAEDTYWGMMDQCEQMLVSVVRDLGRDPVLDYQGGRVNLAPPWERLSVAQAFEKFAALSVAECLEKSRFDEVLAFEVEPHLGMARPLFLYDYPEACGALAKLKAGSRHLAERFELYIRGIEICNAFSELTDPHEQRIRFEAEKKIRASAGRDDYPLPEKFLSALKDMPDAAGNALGIDRLVMLFADTACIDDVVAFMPEEL
ncbi:MAG: EF-P lysine aminoacylase GenX [Deltaproteobacteria bacterium]|nr:EF-P lysine aminoacylase GenX [Deltaproteobacteria bacterium]MBW2678453.1 EF-P lysine aminoacylase GenX [Deltaproteobacteria bacterium]